MGADILTDPILADIDACLERSGLTDTGFSRRCLGDPTLVRKLRRGRGVRPTTRKRILDFINQISQSAPINSIQGAEQ
jgi:hypothetical protein